MGDLEERGLIEGHIRVLRSGKILFVPKQDDAVASAYGWDTAQVPEVTVYPNHAGSAYDKDVVLVKLDKRSISKEKPRRGQSKKNKRAQSKEAEKLAVLDAETIRVRVVQVLRRGGTQWVGVFCRGGRFGTVRGDGIKMPESVLVDKKPKMAVQVGQMVVLEPVNWGENGGVARGVVSEVLGFADDPHVDVESIIRKHDLRVEFPPQVEQEMARWNEHDVLEKDMQEEWLRREDWTNRLVVTIDPATAKDFDDAICVERWQDGWMLAVHIADVSHYVPVDSPLDREAYLRGNSTYLPDRVLPMLPARLSDDLCSLRADVLRLTKVCVMYINATGRVEKSYVADAWIKSASRLAYSEAMAMIAAKGGGAVHKMVREAWKLATLLRQNRFRNGALDLEFPEVRIDLAQDGSVNAVGVEAHDESHQLIEEFMLLANETVALSLKNASIPTLYRVHEEPDASKLTEFAVLCREYGLPVHELQVRQNLTKLLNSIKGHADESLLMLELLKSLMRARYEAEPLGHFGLATTNYCHFTSPIRRYADLVVHRSLHKLLVNPPRQRGYVYNKQTLQEVAEHISQTERVSAEAEKEATAIKLYTWLEAQVYAAHPMIHEAFVREVRPFGVLVEIPNLQVRGMVRTPDFPLARDGRRLRWNYNMGAKRWDSTGGEELKPGSRLEVIPVKVDFTARWIDLSARFLKE